MLLCSYKTWRHGIKIRKITFWGTQLYTAKRKKWTSSQRLKKWLKALYSTSCKQITKTFHQPDSPSASVENALATKRVEFKSFQKQIGLPGLSMPSRISVCSCSTLSNPHSLTNYTLGSNSCQQLFIFQTLKDQTSEILSLESQQQRFYWIHQGKNSTQIINPNIKNNKKQLSHISRVLTTDKLSACLSIRWDWIYQLYLTVALKAVSVKCCLSQMTMLTLLHRNTNPMCCLRD